MKHSGHRIPWRLFSKGDSDQAQQPRWGHTDWRRVEPELGLGLSRAVMMMGSGAGDLEGRTASIRDCLWGDEKGANIHSRSWLGGWWCPGWNPGGGAGCGQEIMLSFGPAISSRSLRDGALRQ